MSHHHISPVRLTNAEQRRGVIDLFISLPVSPFGSQACVTKLDVMYLRDSAHKNFAQLEESLKKKKRDDKTFSILRKTLGCFLENEVSDEEFPPDE
ncbi:unnamed protein product [Brassica oleracea var. botrytis]